MAADAPDRASSAVPARARRRPDQPGLGPYAGPAVVVGLVVVVLVLGLLVSLVGAVRAPEGVSNSATILGTFPNDPDAPGIPPARADETVAPEAVPGSVPPATTTPSGSDGVGAPAVIDPFDAPLDGWETIGGEWVVDEGALVVPGATADDPVLALRPGDPAVGVGAEVDTSGNEAGLVVGFADLDAYVAAVATPEFGGWRLEVWRDGAPQVEDALAPSTPGTQVQLAVSGGRARLFVDGEEVASLPAPGPLGDRVGFLGRDGPAARWSALLAGPG
ncbi:MAG: hypothetical protein ACR2JF_17465 [Iamia sp.]